MRTLLYKHGGNLWLAISTELHGKESKHEIIKHQRHFCSNMIVSECLQCNNDGIYISESCRQRCRSTIDIATLHITKSLESLDQQVGRVLVLLTVGERQTQQCEHPEPAHYSHKENASFLCVSYTSVLTTDVQCPCTPC